MYSAMVSTLMAAVIQFFFAIRFFQSSSGTLEVDQDWFRKLRRVESFTVISARFQKGTWLNDGCDGWLKNVWVTG